MASVGRKYGGGAAYRSAALGPDPAPISAAALAGLRGITSKAAEDQFEALLTYPSPARIARRPSPTPEPANAEDREDSVQHQRIGHAQPQPQIGDRVASIFEGPKHTLSTSLASLFQKPARKRQRKRRRVEGQEQYIDAGQRAETHCEHCGTLYHAGCVEADHQRACSAARFGFQLKNDPKTSAVVSSFELRPHAQGKAGCAAVPAALIFARNPSKDYTAVTLTLAAIQDELSVGPRPKDLVLFALRDKRIIGCAIAEHASEAYRVPLERAGGSSEGSAQSWSYHDAAKQPGPFCGIKCIWTHKSMLGRGVASALVDAVRKRFCPLAGHVRLRKLAFFCPTPQGLAFAQAYCRSRHQDYMLTYKDTEAAPW